MDKKYKVMIDEDTKIYKKWAKQKVKLLHDSKPDYILLTESSAVPYGWVLKNAWKEMYRGEKIPQFYRTSIGHGVDVDDYSMSKTFPEYIKKRNLDRNKKILIFDEMERKDHLDGPVYRVKEGVENPIKANNATLTKNVNVFKRAGFRNILTFSSGFHFGENVYGSGQSLEWIQNVEQKTGKKLYIKPTDKNRDGIDFGGRIEKNPILRKRALEYIHDLKLLGKEAGQEAETEARKRKNLEGKIASTIAIGSLAVSILFISSGITGNAIASLNQTSSNWIGACLFFIGLIGAFAYFRKR